MKQQITKCQFHDTFRDMGRAEQFSYEGKNALYDHLEDLEEQYDIEIELDVIALCCEYTEYADLEELQQDYSNIEDMEELENHTTVIRIDSDSFIIQQF